MRENPFDRGVVELEARGFHTAQYSRNTPLPRGHRMTKTGIWGSTLRKKCGRAKSTLPHDPGCVRCQRLPELTHPVDSARPPPISSKRVPDWSGPGFRPNSRTGDACRPVPVTPGSPVEFSHPRSATGSSPNLKKRRCRLGARAAVGNDLGIRAGRGP